MRGHDSHRARLDLWIRRDGITPAAGLVAERVVDDGEQPSGHSDSGDLPPAPASIANEQLAELDVAEGMEGTIQLSLADRTIRVTRGDLTALAPNLKHKVTGVDDSALFVTMGGVVSDPSPE